MCTFYRPCHLGHTATLPPKTYSAKPFSYLCIAETLGTSEYNQHA
jgi:hypothetical protein